MRFWQYKKILTRIYERPKVPHLYKAPMSQESTPTGPAEPIVFSADSEDPIWWESPNPEPEASTVKSLIFTRRDGLKVIWNNQFGYKVELKGVILSRNFGNFI